MRLLRGGTKKIRRLSAVSGPEDERIWVAVVLESRRCDARKNMTMMGYRLIDDVICCDKHF